MEISVEKVWDDNENQDGESPKEITVKLLANGEVFQKVKLTAKNERKYVFTDLENEKTVELRKMMLKLEKKFNTPLKKFKLMTTKHALMAQMQKNLL